VRLRGSVRANQPMTSAATPTGTLIQKHHCQPRLAWSVRYFALKNSSGR
jgi:hypothetical protein